MTAAAAPLIAITGVSKAYGGLRPLRLRALEVHPADRVNIAGLDAMAAEVFVHLITGAAVPDEGTIRIGGQDTRAIATDTEWLHSLDRFGIVTRRAVLLESLSVESNLALPLTVAIDPVADAVRDQVGRLAAEVSLPLSCLSEPAARLSPTDRVRLHIARALALDPALLVLEHPTADINEADGRVALGDVVRRAAERRTLAVVAITEDEAFARATGGQMRRLQPASGELAGEGILSRLFGTRRRTTGS